MKNGQNVVLLSSAGVGTAYSSAKALRKYYDVKIIAVDTNPANLITTSILSDVFLQIIPVHKNKFEHTISKIIIDQNVDTYIPFIDEEIFKAASLFEKGEFGKDIFLQVKDSNIAQICLDKLKTFEWLINNGFPTPKTMFIENKNQLRQGFIIKPRQGFGSTIQIISNKDNLNIESFNEIIMQEQCQLPEITIDVHYSRKYDFFVYACRERLETKSGVCTKARIFREPVLGDMGLNLAQKLNLSSFCFQVMTLKNEYVITDINPRLGAGSAMSGAVGLDFHSAMFATLWDENPEKYFLKFNKEQYVTRQFCEFVM